MWSATQRRIGTAALVAVALLTTVSRAQDQSPAGEEPPAREEVLGAGAAFGVIDQERERIWLPAGSPLFELPDAASSRLAMIDALCEIDVLDRTGDWYRVHFDGRTGWVQPDLPSHLRSIDTFPVPEPIAVVTPGFEIANPSERRDLALEALGLTEPNGRLGPWALMTDVTETRLLERLTGIAAGLAGSYRERYGLEPTPAATQAVAVFSTEASYRPFESEATHLAGIGARGHAGSQLAALCIEDQRPDEAATLMVHELTHLMNRTSLGPTPPPWLEEGLANDLAYSRVTRDGRLLLGSIKGDRIAMGNRRSGISIQYSGAVAALAQIIRVRGQRKGTPLEELVRLDQTAFLADEDRQQRYIESAFFVRFLLEGQKGRYADGFKGFLTAVGKAPRTDLMDFLDADWARIERQFDAWLDTQSAQLLR